MILIDMHIHSLFSDGTMTPAALARMGRKRHLSVMALTDHDTTAGLQGWLAACRAEGISALTGIELSANARYTLHILGYRISLNDPKMEERLEYVRRCRNERNALICEKLQSLGCGVSLAEAEDEAGSKVVARPHIARVLIKKGFVSSIKEAFDIYLGSGGKAYEPRARLSAEECVELINEAGGVAALAHPSQTQLDDDSLSKLLRKLKDAGLWGIEAVYNCYSPETVYKYMKLGEKFGLLATAGSDFHGANSPGTELGLPVSESFLPWARLGVKI